MARSFAKTSTALWHDTVWCALTVAAQRLEFLFASQPDLSLVGCLGLSVNRWAAMASNSDGPAVEAALAELVDRDRVAVDRQTEELLLLGFLEREVLSSPNLVKGAARAFSAVHSDTLRAAIVVQLPAKVAAIWPDDVLKLSARDLAEHLQEGFHEHVAEPLSEHLHGTLRSDCEPRTVPGGVASPPRRSKLRRAGADLVKNWRGIDSLTEDRIRTNLASSYTGAELDEAMEGARAALANGSAA